MGLVSTLIQLFGPTLGRVLLAALLKGRVELSFIESGDIAETLADSLDIDGLVDKLTKGDWLAKRKAKPLFERIGDGMASQLVELFKADQVQLSEPERDEVLREVQYVLNRQSLPLLLQTDIDAHRFRRQLASQQPRFAFATLPQQDLFTKLLEACAQLVFAVADQLPHFTRDSTARLLHNDSALLHQSETVLRNQGRILAETYGKQMDREAQTLASQYRTLLDKELNKLHLFGVELMKGAQQPLNVAFIYPKVRQKEAERAREQLAAMERHAPQEKAMSVAEALTQSPRQLVVGRAGYGKTTLLKWGAVQAARDVPEETVAAAPEMAAWRGRVPFFVQLRHFSQEKLPTLERLALALPTIADLWEPHAALTRWVKGELEAGRGLILLDGLDEINAAKRAEAMDWLDKLLTLYPETVAVVSARPEALDDADCAARLQRLRFEEVGLQQMEKGQVLQFVAKWHEAMAHEHCQYAHKEAVPKRGEQLLAALEERQELVQLAQTPLLCAMLCALHLGSEVGELPRDRVQLYRRCIHLLLERDVLREVDPSDYDLDRWPRVDTQLLWLGQLAYWMLKNNQLVLRRRDAERLLGSDDRAQKLTRFLSERSGILQRQTAHEFDFVHRSFQEYLAAREIVRVHAVAEIVRLGQQKEWRETIRLLAGHGVEEDQVIVLETLLTVAREHWHDSRSLHLLAWEFFELLDVPTQQARAIMTQHAWEMATEVRQNQLHLSLVATQVSDLTPLAGLSKLQSVDLNGTQVRDLTPLAGLSKLQSVYLSGTQVSDLTPLQGLSKLQSVDLSDTQVSDLAPLQGLSKLQSVDLSDTQVSDLSPLQGLTKLQSLNLSDTQVSDLTPLQGLSKLQSVDLMSTQVSDLTPLQGLSKLQSVYLSSTQVSDLAPLAALSKLQSVDLMNTQVSDLTPLQGLSKLQSVDLMNTQVSDLTPLQGLGKLQIQLSWEQLRALLPQLERFQSLGLGLEGVEDITLVQRLSKLQSVSLMNTQVSDLTPLQGLSKLQSVDLRNTQVSDLTPLAGLTQLQSVHLSGTQVSDLTPLAGLSKLQSVSLMNTQVSDLTPLAGLSKLQSVHLSGTQVSDLTPLQGLSKLQIVYLWNTQVSDLTPLQGLSKLQGVFLMNTQVSDLTPLAGLSKLQSVYLSETQVSDLTPLQGLSKLQSVDLRGTQVSDLTPLQGLSKLQSLDLTNTQITTDELMAFWETLKQKG